MNAFDVELLGSPPHWWHRPESHRCIEKVLASDGGSETKGLFLIWAFGMVRSQFVAGELFIFAWVNRWILLNFLLLTSKCGWIWMSQNLWFSFIFEHPQLPVFFMLFTRGVHWLWSIDILHQDRVGILAEWRPGSDKFYLDSVYSQQGLTFIELMK